MKLVSMNTLGPVSLALMVGAVVLGVTMRAEAGTKMIACPLSEGGVVYFGESSKSKTGYAIAYRPEGTGIWNTDAKDVEIGDEAHPETLRGATLVNIFASGVNCRLEIQEFGKRDGATFTCADRPARPIAATCKVQSARLGE